MDVLSMSRPTDIATSIYCSSGGASVPSVTLLFRTVAQAQAAHEWLLELQKDGQIHTAEKPTASGEVLPPKLREALKEFAREMARTSVAYGPDRAISMLNAAIRKGLRDSQSDAGVKQ